MKNSIPILAVKSHKKMCFETKFELKKWHKQSLVTRTQMYENNLLEIITNDLI